MLSLITKLLLDISPFRRGLDDAKGEAKRATSQMASEVGNDLKSQLKSWVGIAALASYGAKQIDAAVKATDAAMINGTSPAEELAKVQVLERLGDASKVAADEYRRLIDVAKTSLPTDDAIRSLAESVAFMKQNLREGQKDVTGFMAGVANAARWVMKHGNAVDESLQSAAIRILTPAKNEGVGFFGRAKDAFSNMPKAYRAAVAGADAAYAARIEAERIKPPPPTPPPKKEEKAIGAGRTNQVFDPRLMQGGLASAGMFFGGAGNPLLKHAQRQGDLAQKQLEELARIQRAIREEL